MTTPAGHTRAILASRVKGTNVYGPGGAVVGHVEDIVLDKMSNEILFAVIGFGGLAGMGEKYHPVPWSSLDYDKQTGGYVVGFGQEFLENAPTYQLDELTEEDGKFIQKATEYYHRPH